MKKLLLALFVLLCSSNSYASIFEVKDIEVKFTKFNSQTVRGYAVDAAAKKGFKILLENIVPQEYSLDNILTSYDVKKSGLVEKFNIKSEKTNNGYYTAILDVLYNKTELKRVLKQYRLPYTEQDMGSFLLLAIQQNQDGDLLLFEELNTFAPALEKVLQQSLLAEPILPKANLQEISKYNASSIINNNNYQQILAMATKYNTNKVMIVLLQEDSQVTQDMYNVTVNYINFADQEEQKFIIYGQDMNSVAEQVGQRVVGSWKAKNLIQFNKPKRFLATIDVTGPLSDYEQIIKSLKSLSTVSSVTLRTLTSKEALVQTDFYGAPDEFLKATKEKGLNIFQNSQQRWVIERLAN